MKEFFKKYELAIVVISVTLFLLGVARLSYDSVQPDTFTLKEIGYNGDHEEIANNPIGDKPEAANESEKQSDAVDRATENHKFVAGEIFLKTNIKMVNTMLDWRGGWLPNDLIFPTQFLDNNINFQLGWRETYLRTILVLRESLSRQDRSTSPIDHDIDSAYGHISVKPTSFLMPRYEGQLKDSISDLKNYKENLRNGKAGFYTRADLLVKVLEQYASLLGSTANKLTGKDVGWFNQDDRFYFAKGVSYGMYHNLLALRVEFRKELNKEGGDLVIKSIIDELRKTLFEPHVVMNGKRDGVFNSHLAQENMHLLFARQKMNSLSSILLHRGSPSGG